MERFPVIIKFGAAVLAFTAAKMIVSEPLLDPVYGGPNATAPAQTLQTVAEYATYALAIAGVLGAGMWAVRRQQPTAGQNPSTKH